MDDWISTKYISIHLIKIMHFIIFFPMYLSFNTLEITCPHTAQIPLEVPKTEHERIMRNNYPLSCPQIHNSKEHICMPLMYTIGYQKTKNGI